MQRVWRAFLRLFFRMLYNELAWSYDLVASLVSRGQWKAWGRTSLTHVQGEYVLELGHGPGHLLIALAERGFSAVGLDLSPTMARQAGRRLRSSSLSVPLMQARAQALPFRQGSFDSIITTFPTSFIIHRQTLHEVRRVLAPDGRLIITLSASLGGEDLVSRLLSWLYRVTGQDQADPEAFASRLRLAGMSSRIVWDQVNRTTVMLVIAENDSHRCRHLT